MCGIVGYIGYRNAVNIMLEGLKRLEYRGYDSAGICLLKNNEYLIERSKGKIAALEQKIDPKKMIGSTGIGHTRWATHGEPSSANAHPHRAGDIVLVHNGIIENYLELKSELAAIGHTFKSETDTEVIAHLIQQFEYNGNDFVQSVFKAIKRLKGAYALVIMNRKYPDKIIVAKNASPLVIGLGENEQFIASDIPAILSYTKRNIILREGELGIVTSKEVKIYNIDNETEIKPEITVANWSPLMAEKSGYKHFMLKEIFEQPVAITDTIRGRINIESGKINFEKFRMTGSEISNLRRIVISACGTSYHAALLGKYYIEKQTSIPVETIIASEFHYQNAVFTKNDFFIAISQSGETADTLDAIKTVKKTGCKVLSICNVVGSSIPRASDYVIYTHAGPEISVASTKAFSTQIAVLYMLAIFLGQALNNIDVQKSKKLIAAFTEIPNILQDILNDADSIYKLAENYFNYHNMLYLGRGVNWPVALEGALKLKEISYIHAEGYPAGEMKHGPIALLDEQMPVLIIATEGVHYERIFSNLREAKARKAKIIAIATNGDQAISQYANDVISIPSVHLDLQPFLATLPLQLLAYYVADIRGTDVDQPRNLAKSVTVF